MKTIFDLPRPPDRRDPADRDVVELDHQLLGLLHEEGVGSSDWIRREQEQVREVLKGLRVGPR